MPGTITRSALHHYRGLHPREPWGQYRFQLAGPQGLFVEVLQRVPPDPQWLRDNDLAPE